jgi:hypothetical protein
MRYALVTHLGLFALDEVQARALPTGDNAGNALTKRAAELDFTHISDYHLDDPRNNGLANPFLKSDSPRRRDLSYRWNELTKRFAAPPPRPPPKAPPRPKPVRPFGVGWHNGLSPLFFVWI